jgi:hypothetical protein
MNCRIRREPGKPLRQDARSTPETTVELSPQRRIE